MSYFFRFRLDGAGYTEYTHLNHFRKGAFPVAWNMYDAAVMTEAFVCGGYYFAYVQSRRRE